MRALVDVGIFYTMCDGKSFVIAHFLIEPLASINP